MLKKDLKFLAQSSIIAALYVVLTMLSAVAGLASGVVQVRISEALYILACFTPAAVPGLFAGCFISNIISGCVFWDVVFGSLATLLGAFGTRLLKNKRYLASVPPILCNTVVVPLVLSRVSHIETAIWILILSVGAGEIIACGILGQLLYSAVVKHPEMFESHS